FVLFLFQKGHSTTFSDQAYICFKKKRAAADQKPTANAALVHTCSVCRVSMLNVLQSNGSSNMDLLN
uniref:Uncharacterized protein n=1 Tax=Oncorhynchus tshawytscha TaxID=74940 RepID=A0A8C8LVU8_ONCTS